MEQLNAIAFALALFGGMHDLLTRKIPNWFTFPAMLAGLAAQAYFLGGAGFLNGLAGAALAFACFFPMYAFAYMGAGDVKLLMVVGAWMGVRYSFQVMVASVLLGAAFALVEVIYRGRLLAVVKNIYTFLRSVFVPALVAERIKVDEKRKFAFGVCIAGAVALVIYLEQAGRLV
jgi:prepilin peptidase CpaA